MGFFFFVGFGEFNGVLAMVGGSKSAIFKLRNRLDIVRRKKKAVVGYLKRDIAELLEAGHDENAYGRVCFFFFFICSSKNIEILVLCS